jgi:hypothetical protein
MRDTSQRLSVSAIESRCSIAQLLDILGRLSYPKRTCRRYTAAFKLEVALAALIERQPLAELAAHYRISSR